MSNIAEEFMEKTKYKYLGESDQSRGLPQPPLEAECDLTGPGIALPEPASLEYGKKALIDVIDSRRSLRQYSNDSFSPCELSYLLWCTQGVRRFREGVASYRSVPSAGARHAFETFLLINRVEGIEPGLYRYRAFEHKLITVELGPGVAEKVVAGCLDQKFIGNSAVTFIWVADTERMKWRYDVRGYRYLHLDAGHVCQNLYLSVESIDGGACAIAAFDDDLINEVLGLDGVRQFVIYIASAGKKQHAADPV